MKDKKLKTLKDLEEQDYLKMEDGENFVSTKKIKQEAIKWVKELKDADEQLNAIGFILKFFFNLTEKEVKK